MRVSGRKDMIEMIFATGIPFGGRAQLPGALREIAALAPQTAGIRRMGAAALDLAYVAAGRCDGYWERDLNPWDMAAGILLVREAGGFVGTIEEGGKLFVERSIVAANANVYEGLRKVLQSA
jgi:myo-inositol-1(or 4)-monophosphatase